MTATNIVEQLKELGSTSIKRVLLKHGINEPLYGVKIEELKKIQKKIKEDHKLALELYATGIYDAMYLAGLIAEPGKMTKEQLQQWALQSNSYALSETTVAWVTAESRYGMELALEWIKSANETIASTGWATLSSFVAIKPDTELNISLLQQLLTDIVSTIHNSPNRVKSTMNSFVIASGVYVLEITEFTKQAAIQIGAVIVDVGNTACKVPFAVDYIEKAASKNRIGKKRKMARC